MLRPRKTRSAAALSRALANPIHYDQNFGVHFWRISAGIASFMRCHNGARLC